METIIQLVVFLAVAKSSFSFNEQHGPYVDVGSMSDERFAVLFRRLDHLESREHDQGREIDNLRSELLVQNRRVAALENAVRRMRVDRTKEMENLHGTTPTDTDVSTEGSKPTANTEERLENTISREIHTQGSRKSAHSRSHGRIRSIGHNCDSNVVAFFATLKQHQRHMGVNQKVRFDNVVTNVGNGYNGHFGAFIAPKNGVYVFTVSVHGLQNSTTILSFEKNGKPLSNLYLHNNGGTSQTVILQLDKGDDVVVGNDVMDGAVTGYMYTMMSGFLLAPLTASGAVPCFDPVG